MGNGKLSPLNPVLLANLRDHVHGELRRAIFAARFGQGERLSERDLARELGVSTTPLKEALRQLEAEGLVRAEPRRGVFVTFGRRQAQEMFLARSALESMIARLAARDASEADCVALRGHVKEMRTATQSGDVDRLVALNEAFHDRIHDASGCDYLRRLQARQEVYDHAARVALLAEKDERTRALGEHRAIQEAVCARDEDAAERIMRDHVVRSGKRHVEAVFGLETREVAA